MTFFGGADPLKVVRNTSVLERERARLRAAARLGNPFVGVAVPLLAFGGVFQGMALTGRIGHAAQGAGLLLLLGGVGLVLGGAFRRMAYLKSHPSDL